MNYQKIRIDFTQKRSSTTPVTFKTGEVDMDGIEAELVNIDVSGSPSGYVSIHDPEGTKTEAHVTFENGFARFDIPKKIEGVHTFELTILNKGNKTRSGNLEIEVIRSLNDNTVEYEDLLANVVKNDAAYTTNENERKSNEVTRVSNENTRITQHADRMKKTDQAVIDVNNTIASGTVDLETKNARTDANNIVHANLKVRLDSDYNKLASKIPTDLAVSGIETLTVNDTVSGELKNTVVSGNTMVNMYPLSAT
ncbi:MAG: hypothetical protein ACRC1D_03650, partial [Culicoidibacterales bacterium]